MRSIRGDEAATPAGLAGHQAVPEQLLFSASLQRQRGEKDASPNSPIAFPCCIYGRREKSAMLLHTTSLLLHVYYMFSIC